MSPSASRAAEGEGRAMSKGWFFDGIDRGVADSRLRGVLIDGGAITVEAIEEASRLILEQPNRPPCGSKESPHLVAPGKPEDKKPVYRCCVQCGDVGWVNFETGHFIESFTPPEKL